MNRVGIVIGIDVGWANLACCVLDANWRSPVRWTNERILEKGTYTKEKLWSATYQWCLVNQKMLSDASMIVLEEQIEIPFIIMNTVIRTLHPSLAVVVAPATISAKFGLAKTRKEKKADAVKLVGNNLRIPQASKKDDLADAYLLAIWGFQQLELPLEGWKKLK